MLSFVPVIVSAATLVAIFFAPTSAPANRARYH